RQQLGDAMTELSHQAYHDPLTGLANRFLFNERLEHASRQASRRAGRIAVLLLDLDQFKAVNDGMGHAVGDALLVAVAQRLEKVTRACDTVARLGGDEFAFLLEDVGSDAEIELVVQRLLAMFDAPFQI